MYIYIYVCVSIYVSTLCLYSSILPATSLGLYVLFYIHDSCSVPVMTMANVSTCSDMSDAVELYELQGLYLKPVAKMNICIQLPLIKTPGKTISNWEVMEKVKHMIRPDNFMTMKVSLLMADVVYMF